MPDVPAAVRSRLESIAAQHGVSADTAATLFRAFAASGGGMAQFSIPELGGMGQWSPGMTMVGDMFNSGLRERVAALCTEMAALVRENLPAAGTAPMGVAGSWWPAELGAPASSGGQNDMRYAYFPAAHRLAVQQGGHVRVYDTAEHNIYGVSQQQGAGQSLSFATEAGPVALERMRPVGEAPAAAPASPAAANGDPLAVLERLSDLHKNGVLTEAEFAAKKVELLGRL